MDCGIPFCHQGCPLGNLIPDWNDLVYRDQWRAAIDRLHATNNFPEFTGKLCPAPCEASCVLGINNDPVTIKQIEASIIDQAWEEGWVVAPAAPRSGPARRSRSSARARPGLACAQQLARAGHAVTVFERADRIGGLLRYGIPDFKMEKRHLDRRLDQMEAEGVVFKPGVERRRRRRRRASSWPSSTPSASAAAPPSPATCRSRAASSRASTSPWSSCPSRTGGWPATRTTSTTFISAKDKHVIIIGGGDTGADCLGTVHRQGCKSVHQFEIVPRPPDSRIPDEPLAAVVERLPRLVGPRGGGRPRVLDQHQAVPRRGGPASRPWRRSRSR